MTSSRIAVALPRPISCCRLEALKLPSAAYRAIDITIARRCGDRDLDACADGCAVHRDPLQPERDPIVTVAGIDE